MDGQLTAEQLTSLGNWKPKIYSYSHDGSMYATVYIYIWYYMVTFTINIPPMLAFFYQHHGSVMGFAGSDGPAAASLFDDFFRLGGSVERPFCRADRRDKFPNYNGLVQKQGTETKKC